MQTSSQPQNPISFPDAEQLKILKRLVDPYFVALNESRFDDAALQFADDGVLDPPFHEPLIGREAIATYFKKEAVGMLLQPLSYDQSELPLTQPCIRVSGKVNHSMFSVNVSWTFAFDPEGLITYLEVKLLARLEELFQVRSKL